MVIRKRIVVNTQMYLFGGHDLGMRFMALCVLLMCSQARADSDWELESFADEMTDVVTHRVVGSADRDVEYLGVSGVPRLAFECEAKPKWFRIVVYAGFPVKAELTTNPLLVGIPELRWDVYVAIRFDDGRPATHQFLAKTTTEGSAEVAMIGNPWRLMNKFSSAERALLRVEALLGGERTFSFSMAGAKPLLPELKRLCGLRKLKVD